MRTLLILLLVLALSACSGGAGAPLDEPGVTALLRQHLQLIAEGVSREDPFLASQPVSELFVMGNNIAVRFRDAGWENSGIGAFRSFFATVFDLHENILLELELLEVDIVGDVATAKVKVDFNSVRVDRVPPENVTSSSEDYMLFQREAGAWLLIRWDEVPPPPPHDEGSGESV